MTQGYASVLEKNGMEGYPIPIETQAREKRRALEETRARERRRTLEDGAYGENDWRELAGIRERQMEEQREQMLQRQIKLAQQQRTQERRVRRQCLILGLISLALAGGILWQSTRDHGENRQLVVFPKIFSKTDDGRETAGTDQADLLALVNKDHALPEEYSVNLHWLRNGRTAVAEEMYDSLAEMLSDGTDAGGEFVVASGYRSWSEQQDLLEEDIRTTMESEGLTRQEAYDLESRETMPAGHSEHETGLAVDIVSLSNQVLDSSQVDTFENRWLLEHCSEYGFILRYPQGCETITGIDYEPWHFRFVGKEAAGEIMRRGITLEEYLQEKAER